jgi:hypothetical protein
MTHSPTTTASAEMTKKPHLVFFRGSTGDLPTYIPPRNNLPHFILDHLEKHTKCLSQFFDVTLIRGDCDYEQICAQYKPHLALFESGVYGSPHEITNTYAFPEIPKLGFLNADAYCVTRNVFLSNMERWGVETYFTISVSMAEYIPMAAENLFVWPNFADADVFRNYGEPKRVPVLITGSRAAHYPWRNQISETIANHFPSLTCPHFGWFDGQTASRAIYGEEYARLINASYFVPTCGTIAKEVVRKHFEIPGSNSCLVTEETQGLQAAGFVDMENCVFVTEADVLDKLEYLFKNRDVLERITDAGHQLVHLHHTLRQRNQMLQWLTLHNDLRPHQRIVQMGPFGCLTTVNSESGITNYHTLSTGIDRALLRKGDTLLRSGQYDEAERNYISCLNYHFMPEPIIGLTLCNLYRGDARAALQWIAQPITLALDTHKAPDPDPVEWTYFIISLLCQGQVYEATRRVHQFPSLRHEELERCRHVMDILNRSMYSHSKRSDNNTGAPSRPSIHQLPQRTMESWVNELCVMLRACRQGGLAERLQKLACPPRTVQTARLSLSGKGGQIKRLTNSVQVGAILPIMPERFHHKICTRVTSKIRDYMLSPFRKHAEEFTFAIRREASKAHVNNALIISVFDGSPSICAFLGGLERNPSQPAVFILGPPIKQSRKLQKGVTKYLRITYISGPVSTARREAEVECFDIVLIDRDVPDEGEVYEAVTGARTILLGDIDTYSGYRLKCRLLGDDNYRIIADKMIHRSRYAIFIKVQKEEFASDVEAAGNS